jgi:hypothetical protein
LKGVVFERWAKELYFVAQEPTYQNLMDRYGFHELYDMNLDLSDNIVFMIYDLVKDAHQYKLAQTRIESATIDEMLSAIENGLKIPSKEKSVATKQYKSWGLVSVTRSWANAPIRVPSPCPSESVNVLVNSCLISSLLLRRLVSSFMVFPLGQRREGNPALRFSAG